MSVRALAAISLTLRDGAPLSMSILRKLPPTAAGQLAIAERWFLAYRELGLPAWLDSPHLIVRTSARLDAIEMPAALGEAVRSQLCQHFMAGSILRTTEDRWVFLTTPGNASRAVAYLQLEQAGAHLHPHWTRIPLPTGQPHETHCWITEPTGKPLPTLHTIATMVRKLHQTSATPDTDQVIL